MSRGECCENERSEVGHENLCFFFFHDPSASVCARMMLALAVHVSQRTEKKKKQSRSEFEVGRDVADGMMRLAAAAAVVALGARTEAACSGRGLAEGHGFAVKGGAGVAGWCGDVTSGCGGLLISERQWGRSEAIVAQSDTAVGRPKKRRCLLMVRPYVMSGAPVARGFWIQQVRMRRGSR